MCLLEKKRTAFIDEFYRFQSFVCDNYRHLFFASLLLLLVYSGWLFNVDPRIDTEELINKPYNVYNWLTIGRQGMILTEWVFGIRWFNPYFSILVGFLFLCISGVFLGFLISRIGHINGVVCSYLSLMIYCSPIMTEQFYFTLQIFEIAWGYVLVTIAVGLSYYGILSHAVMPKVASVIGMVWIFCTYQSFTIIYIGVVMFLFILLYERWEFNEERGQSGRKYISVIGQHIILFGFAFIVNFFIVKLFFYTQSVYLGDQQHWGKEPIWQCAKNILGVIGNELFGWEIFYTAFFGLFSILTILFAVINCCVKKTKLWWLYFVAVFGLQLCPFLLNFYLGGGVSVRSELAYPVVLALNIVFCLIHTKKIKFSKLPLAAVCVMCVVCVWRQSGITMRLIYTDNVRAQEDIKLAMELEMVINDISSLDKPIAFIGGYSCKLNNACLRDGITSHSVFDWDAYVEPHYSRSTYRSVGMLNVLGISTQSASEEQIFEARKAALNMPSWPDYNSVKDMGDYVVVKLSDDLWVEDLTEAN